MIAVGFNDLSEISVLILGPEPGGEDLDFVEAVEASAPGYFVRLIGGLFWVTGMLIMAFNVYMTVKRREAISHSAPQAA